MIMGTKPAKTCSSVDEFGNFGHRWYASDPEERIYYLQKDSYQIEGQHDNVKKADNLKLNCT